MLTTKHKRYYIPNDGATLWDRTFNRWPCAHESSILSAGTSFFSHQEDFGGFIIRIESCGVSWGGVIEVLPFFF